MLGNRMDRILSLLVLRRLRPVLLLHRHGGIRPSSRPRGTLRRDPGSAPGSPVSGARVPGGPTARPSLVPSHEKSSIAVMPLSSVGASRSQTFWPCSSNLLGWRGRKTRFREGPGRARRAGPWEGGVPERILIVEDEESFRESLRLELEEAGYLVDAASNGLEAVQKAAQEHYDLIVCDVRLPGINGLETLDSLEETQPCARRIVITGYASSDAPIQALRMKVDDYLLKPFPAQDFLASVRRALEENRLRAVREGEVRGLREGLTRLVSSIHYESRFAHLAGHSERVANLCLAMARELGFSRSRAQTLYLSGLLHDIGLVELPPRLLQESHLTDEEMDLIRTHPARARSLLEPFGELHEVAAIILHHHERWDGSGYPRGLQAEQIPLESRILALAEAYDSLVSERPHRRRCTAEDGLKLLERQAGKAFDPELVSVFVRAVELSGARETSLPPPPAPSRARQAELLLNMADAYREWGRLDLAEAALSQVEPMVDTEDPKLLLRARRARILLRERAGDRCGALQQARELLAESRQAGLPYVVGQSLLELSRLALMEGSNEEVGDWLEEARQLFTVWESGYDLCRAALLEACLCAAQRPEAVSEPFGRFVEIFQRSRAAEVLLAHREEASSLLHIVLEKGLCPQDCATLVREGGIGAVPILERLLEVPDRELRLRVVELLGHSPERQARSLLSQARLDPWRAVSQRAEALLEQSPETSRTLGLQIQLLGKLKVLVGSEPIEEDQWPTRKIRSLLACLACARGEPVSEEKLMARFWERSGEKARHSLHNSISQIRRVLVERLGPAARRALVKRQEGYTFSRDFPCRVDLEEFRERLLRGRYLAERGRWDEALVELQRVDRLYRGEFLEGIYEEWCEDLRLKCLGSLIEALQLMAQYFLDRGKPEVSADYWRRILARDNCHEDSYLGLMSCSLHQGRASEAVKIYHQCAQILKKELNLSPPPRMVEIYLRTVRQDPVTSQV